MAFDLFGKDDPTYTSLSLHSPSIGEREAQSPCPNVSGGTRDPRTPNAPFLSSYAFASGSLREAADSYKITSSLVPWVIVAWIFRQCFNSPRPEALYLG